MKKLAMSVAGMAFAVVATSASAIDVDLGDIPMNGEFEIVTFDNVVENTNGSEGTRFIDTFSFNIVDEGATADISISRLPVTLRGEEIFLFDEWLTVLRNGGERIRLDADGQTGDLDLELGTYTITVSGRSIGRVGGQYFGAVVVSTAVVPIPAAGLLFFSGIAALGLVRSKRASA